MTTWSATSGGNVARTESSNTATSSQVSPDQGPRNLLRQPLAMSARCCPRESRHAAESPTVVPATAPASSAFPAAFSRAVPFDAAIYSPFVTSIRYRTSSILLIKGLVSDNFISTQGGKLCSRAPCVRKGSHPLCTRKSISDRGNRLPDSPQHESPRLYNIILSRRDGRLLRA